MGGGKGGGGDTETTIRYASYIETAHQDMINDAHAWKEALIAPSNSPYDDYTIPDPEGGFFAANTIISDYPSMYDMYGKFMAGLDLEQIWEQHHSDSAYGEVINEIVETESNLLEDELNAQLAQLKAGYRNANAVMSSSFIIADGNMRDTKVKAIAKLRSDLRARFTEIGQRRWETHLRWNDGVIARYLDINRLYFALKFDYVDKQSEQDSRHVLWPFTVLDSERVIMAALQGATNSKTKGEHNKVAGALSGALGGAAMGASIGGPVGAVAGGALGLLGGLFG
jgi:hypothetical protein